MGRLADDVCRYAALAIAPSTRRAYSTGERRFLSFCQLHRLDALPATDMVLSCFAAFLTRTVKPGTIKSYLSAVRNMHLELGFADPSMTTTLLPRVLRGICRVQGTAPEKTKLPMTMPVLRQVLAALQASEAYSAADKAMLRAAMLFAFHGFLRCGEFTVPTSGSGLPCATRADVRVEADPPSLVFQLRRSKTDPDGNGVDIHIGPSAPPVCAVLAMATYLAVTTASPSAPLFQYSSGAPLHRESFVEDVRKLLVAAGVDNSRHYAGHSFRIGAATTAALCGTPEWVIRAMGRWRSDCVYRYIRTSRQTCHGVAARLALVQ